MLWTGEKSIDNGKRKGYGGEERGNNMAHEHLKNQTEEQRAEMKAKADATREKMRNVPAIMAELLNDLESTKQGRQVEDRLEQMPVSRRATYTKAMRGRSRGSAIRAFCQMCVGWQISVDGENQIEDCTDLGCPLYPYRPYREGGEE